MTVNRTTLLNLPLPVTGTESGLWGDYTNNGFTEYVDTAVAGALSITASVTLANTTGTNSATGITTTTAQYRTLVVPAAGVAANVVITAPSSNRTYHIINRNATYTVQVRAGTNSGVTLGTNQSATVTYDSVAGDYVLVGTIGPTVPVARGGTGLTSGTSGGVLYYSATGTLASSAALAASSVVLGGGAGAAPATTTTGTGVVTAIGNATNAANGLAVLNASGLLAIAQGGTNATATPTAGAVPYGTGTAYAFTSAGTAGQVLTSNGSSAPTWTSVTTGMTSISFGSTGLTPATATGGAVTVAGTLAVSNGGTGVTSPGTAGNVLTSNGTSWTSAPAGGASLSVVYFNSSFN